MKVATECHVDTIQDSIDKVTRALLRDAESEVEAYVKASCCQDSTLKLVILLQAATRSEEEDAVKNIEAALLDPQSALRSELYASPDSLEVVDNDYLAAGETGASTTGGLTANQQLGLALGAFLLSIVILSGVSYHRRQKRLQNSSTQQNGEQAMEDGVVEGETLDE